MPDQRYQEQQASTAYQPGLSVPLTTTTRPRILARTHSSPNATAIYTDNQEQQQQQQPWQTTLTPAAPHTGAGLGIDAETRSNGLLQTNNDAEHEVNIAVVGCVGVGKSSFIRQSLSLTAHPTSAVSSCRITVDSTTFLVRMLEYQREDVIIDKDNRITWPTDPRILTVDAACTLYDVSNKDSYQDVPVVLSESPTPSTMTTKLTLVQTHSRKLRSLPSLSQTNATGPIVNSTQTTSNSEQRPFFARSSLCSRPHRMSTPTQKE
jgi:hypothetical protein